VVVGSCPPSGGKVTLPPTHSNSVEAVPAPLSGEADTLPTALNSCNKQLLSKDNLIQQHVVRGTAAIFSVVEVGPHTSGVEAVSCPPSGGEDTLSLTHSRSVEALLAPPSVGSGTLPTALISCNKQLLSINNPLYTSDVEAASFPPRGGEVTLSSTHSSAQAVPVPPGGKVGTMPTTLNGYLKQLFSNDSVDEIVPCPPSGVVSTLPPTNYISDAEAAS
jgi:hypothetical protein